MAIFFPNCVFSWNRDITTERAPPVLAGEDGWLEEKEKKGRRFSDPAVARITTGKFIAKLSPRLPVSPLSLLTHAACVL